MAEYDLYEKNILIIMALRIEYPVFLHFSSSALCASPQIDSEMNRGLLNWLLCDYIKSVRVRERGKTWEGGDRVPEH